MERPAIDERKTTTTIRVRRSIPYSISYLRFQVEQEGFVPSLCCHCHEGCVDEQQIHFFSSTSQIRRHVTSSIQSTILLVKQTMTFSGCIMMAADTIEVTDVLADL